MDRRRWTGMVSVILMIVLLLTSCGSKADEKGNGQASPFADGSYPVNVTLEGGSGRATVSSPAELTIKDGNMTAKITWSSDKYDYMIVKGEKYLPVNTEGNSTFEIPIEKLDEAMEVIGDTTAMSTPHEITYQLTFSMADGQNEADGSGNGDGGSSDGSGSGQSDLALTKIDPTTISSALTYDSSMELSYAKEFCVDYYKEGYTLFQIAGDGAYLLIPEGQTAPEDLSKDIVILQKPIDNIYLVASAVMDMFRCVDGLDKIRFSGLKEDAWYLPEVAEAMKSGDILYAGKYSAPDYEKIMAEKCSLAIENTMIYHTPAVKEQLERFKIPVMVDHSSYEEEPLARMEWVKLYGLLTEKEKEAEAAFADQVAAFDQIEGQKKDHATLAFFYFTNDGQVNVRKSSDYLPRMIELAGGQYIFKDLGDDSTGAASTISMQMEEFYAAAKDADYMIYNSTTVGEVESLQDLLAKNSLLSKCKAVQENKVYCTSKNLYQSSMELGTIIGDFQKMLQGEEELEYLYHLQ